MTTIELPLIIIGTGLSGYSLAKEFRKLNKERELILITEDDGHFYSKPQLSIALEQNKHPDDLIVTDVAKMQIQLNAKIFTHSSVKNLDPLTQTLQLNTPTGTICLSYGHCVLAIGACPNPLSLLESSPHHFRINNLHSYRQFRDVLNQVKELTIIGSGLVGCELMHDFSRQNIPISVITPDPYPLYRLAPKEIGFALQKVLEAKGITFYTDERIIHATVGKNSTALSLSSTKKIHTQLILSAIGLTPNIAFTQLAGIHSQAGIVVDDYCQTNLSNVFALGDCAQMHGITRQYVAPILHCARALAQTLCQNPTPVLLPHTPIVLKVSSYPVSVLPPPANLKGSWHITQVLQDFRCLFYDEANRLQGYALSGKLVSEKQSLLQQLGKTDVLMMA